MTEPDDVDEPRPARLIDLGPALHIAGHESELLHFEGLEDSGPLVHADSPEEHVETAEELAHRIGLDTDIVDDDRRSR